MKDKNKIIVLISGVLVILLMVVGISFAIFRFGEESTNQELVLGDIWMKYTESNGIQLENALPGDEYTNYFEFTITGTNTYTKKDIYYDISLTHGDIPAGKEESNRVEDKYLKFKLTEVNGDTETEIFTDKTYDDLTNKRVHVDTISKSTSTYSKTYRLYMVISEELTYGNSSDAILTTEEFSSIFGSVKVNVTGDFIEKEISKTAGEEIIEKVTLYSVASSEDFSGGLVAINGTEGDDYGLLYNETNNTHTIREYRYTGLDVDNYIYYNCSDTAGDKTYGDLDYDYAANCEVWRIVGIFNENGEERIKITKNTTLTTNELPETYVYDNTTFTIENIALPGSGYWNKPDVFRSTNYNDWTESGIRYFLNTEKDTNNLNGYLSLLTTNAKNLIKETTYYLGIVETANAEYLGESTIKMYEKERSEENIPEGNKYSWNGSVALLYPSDFSYTLSPNTWNLWQEEVDDTMLTTSWMNETANHNNEEWLISPSYYGGWWSTDPVAVNPTIGNYVITWNKYIQFFYNHESEEIRDIRIRPTLYLKSNTKILKGDGDENSPYVVVLD